MADLKDSYGIMFWQIKEKYTGLAGTVSNGY